MKSMLQVPSRAAIMIHGAGGGSWEWQKWEPVFAQRGWSVNALHLMPSAEGIEATTIADYSSQVEAAISSSQATETALIGASMGGLLALLAASTLRVDATVLVNPVPPKGFSLGKTYPPLVKWANQPLEKTAAALPDCSEEIIHTAWQSWRDESGLVMNSLGAGCDMHPLPSCPSLVVIGSEDTDIDPTLSLALAKQLKGDVHMYSSMSHVGPLLGHRAEEAAAAVERWLDVTMQRARSG